MERGEDEVMAGGDDGVEANGGIWRLAYKYRPYLVLLAAVVAVIVIPAHRDSNGSARGTTAAQTGGGSGSSEVAGAEIGGGSGPGVTAAGGTAAGVSGSGAAANGGAGAAAATGPAPKDAGIATDAAIHGPMCDPASGRLKFPAYFRPPCVRPWAKGTPNGGATAQGVTADSITVSLVYGGSSIDTTPDREEMKQAWRDLFAIWTGTHETYGREIKLVFNDFGGSGAAPDETQQRAMAVQVAAQKPFVALVMSSGEVLPQELARRGIITMGTSKWRDFEAFAGYLWGTGFSTELSECMTAPYMKKLVGKPAKWAGQPDLQVKTRKFAFMYPETADVGVINNCWAQAGAKPDLTVTYNPDPTAFQQQSPTLVTKLKQNGITTVLGGPGEFYNLKTFTSQATSQRYFPEWVINGQASDDLDFIVRLFAAPEQSAHFFGFGQIGPGTLQAESWFTEIPDWYYGVNQPSWRNQPVGTTPNSLTMMALIKTALTGVHLAGPNLNVKTFQAARFSLPPYGGKACGCITMQQEKSGPGVLPTAMGKVSYIQISDSVEFWWDNSLVGPDGTGLTKGNGMWRYMYRAQRKNLGEFPPGEPPAFDTANTTNNNETQNMPPPDRAASGPNYPCRTRTDQHYSTADAYKGCPSGK